jgi:hypothetical protein
LTNIIIMRGKMCSKALFQLCYIFFTLDFDLLTGKNRGDIINLNSGQAVLFLP